MGERININAPVVELSNVWFSYNGKPVLQDVSLTVTAGSFLGILGPNGSGKTTLVRIIVGLARPFKGNVFLFGVEQGKFRDWSKIGYVPQKTPAMGTFPASVREVVASGRTPQRGFFKPLTRGDFQLIDEAIELVGLTRQANQPITELSGGQQQRVLIARALAGEPQLLVLDEPTVGVDATSQEQFYALLRRLRQERNITIIMVSHDVGVITNEVSHLACLNRRLYFHGPPAEFDPESLSQVYGHPVSVVSHDH